MPTHTNAVKSEFERPFSIVLIIGLQLSSLTSRIPSQPILMIFRDIHGVDVKRRNTKPYVDKTMDAVHCDRQDH